MSIKEALPNFLSSIRILYVPFLLYSSYHGYKNTFLLILFFALITDAVDGFLARVLKVTSNLGARLDSLVDMGAPNSNVKSLFHVCNET